MREYFLCIASAALISALCGALASGTGLEKHVKFVCSLVCTAAVALPLVSAITSHGVELPETAYAAFAEPAYGGYFEETAYENVKEYILSLTFAKTGITALDIGIEINRNGAETLVGGLTVYISKADSGRADELKAALERELGGNVDVEVREDGAAG